MQDQTSAEKKIGRFRGWLIKIGLVPPPKGESGYGGKADTEERRKAKQDLTWHQLRHPQDR